MKSKHEPFESELSDRLRMYTEEPDKRLWERIAPQIGTGSSGLAWSNISTVIVGLSLVIQGYMPGTGEPGLQKDMLNVIQASSDCMLPENAAGKGGSRNAVYKEIGPAGMGHRSRSNLSGFGNLETSDPDLSPQAIQEQLLYPRSPVSSGNVLANNKGALPTREKAIPEIRLAKSLSLIALNNPGPTVVPLLSILKKSKAEKQQAKNTTIVKVFSLKKPTLNFSIMPTLGYQRIEANVYDKTLIESVSVASVISARRLGLRLDFALEWPVGRRIKALAGLSYYHQEQTINYTEKQLDNTILISGPDPGQITVEPIFSYIDKSIKYEMNNLGLQLGLLYKLSLNKDHPLESELYELFETSSPQEKKRFIHWAGAGIEFQKTISKASDANGFYNPTSYIFGNIYYRIQYPSTGKFKVNLQPTFFYSFYTNQNSSSIFLVRPYGVGLSIGCTYKF